MREGDYRAGNPAHNGSSRLVVVSGCSGGGKSTLLAEMARRGYPTQPEPGRLIVKEQLYIDGPGLPWTDIPRFLDQCVERSMLSFNSAQPTDKPVLFDRSLIDAVAGMDRLGLPVPPSTRRAVERYRYGPTVFLVPPWEALFATDEERRHGFADAVIEYEDLLRVYPAYGYRVEIIPQGTIAARADVLEQRLTALLGEAGAGAAALS